MEENQTPNKVSYDIETINYCITMINTIAEDTKLHSGMQLMSDLLDISNHLRQGTLFYDPGISPALREAVRQAEQQVQASETTDTGNVDTIIYDGSVN
ncbi:MAG TPA: hypothetical protein DCW90_00240 [Lachnospiraceae bacterium]|nr:hypothetical protein [Lachnospiraceae bacterium]